MHIFKRFAPIIFNLIILFASGVYFNTTTTCKYPISGKVLVLSYISKDIDQSLLGQEIPIGDAKIKIEQKKCATCRWKKSYETRTNSNGDFYQEALATGNSCQSGIKTRIKIKFESDELELRRGGISDEFGRAPKWYTIGKKTKEECVPGSSCNFGQMTFRINNELDLDDSTATAHADIWYFFNWAIDYFKDIDMPINKSNDKKIRVVYPLNRFLLPDQFEGSYVNPSTKIIHIHEDHLRFDIVMHELAHFWAFNYTSGESIMQDYLFTKFSTHDLVSKSEVAFHEGFADWWMKFLKNIYLNEIGMPSRPHEVLLKKYLNQKMNIQSHQYEKCEHGLTPRRRKKDKGRLECHEKGWLNIFQLLTFDDLHHPGTSLRGEVLTYNLFENQNPNGQFMTKLNHGIKELTPEDLNCRDYPLSLSFKDILQIIDGMDATEMNLADFFNRIKNLMPNHISDIELFSDITDPTNPGSLTTNYCQNSLVVSHFDFNDTYSPEWYEEGDYFVKNTPIRIYVKNMGHIHSPERALIQTPKKNVHTRTAEVYDKKFVPIPLHETSLAPGEETYIEQILKVKKQANGSFPATKVDYKTYIPLAVRKNNNSRLLFGGTRERWRTNMKSIKLGADLSSNINFTKRDFLAFRQVSQIHVPASTILPSKTFHVTKLRPRIRLKKLMTKPRDQSYFTTIIGHCTFKNAGNTSSMINVNASLKINDQLIKSFQLEPINPGHSIRFPFELHIKKHLLKDSPRLSCLIDQGKTQKIKEIKEFNNIATKIIR